MNGDIEDLKILLRHSGASAETNVSAEEIMRKLRGGYLDSEIKRLSKPEQKEIVARNLKTLNPSELLQIADSLDKFSIQQIEDLNGSLFTQMTDEQRRSWADEQIKTIEASIRNSRTTANPETILIGFSNTLNNERSQLLLDGQSSHYSMQLHLMSALSREHPNLSNNGMSLSSEELAIVDLKALIKRVDADEVKEGADVSINPILSRLSATIGIIASNAPASEVTRQLEELKRKLQDTVGVTPNEKVSAFLGSVEKNIERLQLSDEGYAIEPIENFSGLLKVGKEFGITFSQSYRQPRQTITCTEGDGSRLSAFEACRAFSKASSNGGASVDEEQGTATSFPTGEPPDPERLRSELSSFASTTTAPHVQ